VGFFVNKKCYILFVSFIIEKTEILYWLKTGDKKLKEAREKFKNFISNFEVGKVQVQIVP